MSFLERGYEVVEVVDAINGQQMLLETRDALRSKFGQLHSFRPRRGFTDLQAEAAQMAAHLPKNLIYANLSYFQWLLGNNIHIQKVPYLRISRPGHREDNIGFHRDTWYGDTPHEISVWIPLTPIDEGNCLYVAPGSHLWSEKAYPTKRINGTVRKGSLKHKLGFIHSSPKRLKTPVKMTPVLAQPGQMIVFSLALLHGQEVNRSCYTRWSMDCRLTNSQAPIAWERSRARDYYEPLCETPVYKAARLYEAAQTKRRNVND